LLPEASLIIANARVISMDPFAPSFSKKGQVIAIRNQRIIALGDTQQVNSLVGANTRWIDAHERSLLPGFIDSHFHLMSGSAELDNAELVGVNSLGELADAMRQHASRQAAKATGERMDAALLPAKIEFSSTWVTGSHLKYGLLPGGELLTRRHLDEILADRPLVVMAYDYHTLWANTLALQLAGLLPDFDSAEKKPYSAGVVLAEDGLPSGELREPPAYGPVLALTGAWGRASTNLTGIEAARLGAAEQAEDRRLLQRGLALAAKAGVTSIHNMDGNTHSAAMYAALEDLGELTLRIYLPLSVSPQTTTDELQEALEMKRLLHQEEGVASTTRETAPQLVRAGHVKFFMDGVMESWTAFLLDDYADRSGWRGEPIYTPDQFNRLVSECDRLGLQISVHAIGDAAVRQALDGFAKAREINGGRDSRHRIEHIEVIDFEDLPRFSELGVIASMQPLHAPRLGDVWLERAGELRWERSFAWNHLRQAGARLAFGSDWPVVTQNPMLGLHAALNRQVWKTGLSDQRQTLQQALDSYTRQAAYAEFQEQQKGMLRAGYLADMALLSADLQEIPAEEINQVHPILTVCDGRVVYEELPWQ